MYRGPEVQPYAEAPRVTPADTIPVHGEPPMSLEQATIKMHNPLQPTPENLAKGQEQFNTYCAPCHGTSGQGNGTVAHLLAKPPKNLVTGTSKDLPDGYIYGAIATACCRCRRTPKKCRPSSAGRSSCTSDRCRAQPRRPRSQATDPLS